MSCNCNCKCNCNCINCTCNRSNRYIFPQSNNTNTADDAKRKESYVRYYKNLLTTCAYFVEKLNTQYDPFGIKLNNWPIEIAKSIDEYDEVFGRLYEKYKDQITKLPEPEVELFSRFFTSGLMAHLTGQMYDSIPKSFRYDLGTSPKYQFANNYDL